MPSIANPTRTVTPHCRIPSSAVAALLLLAVSLLKRYGLLHPSATEVIEALKVSRARAYTLKNRMETRLCELVAPRGRPPREATEPAPSDLATTLLNYLYEHPGAVSGSADRHRYSRGFRLFVLELVDLHPEIEHEAIARAMALPLPTLKDWRKGGALDVEPEEKDDEHPAVPSAKEGKIATVFEEYSRWDGGFVPFCDHVQKNLHLPFGRTAISTILRAHGVRKPLLRPGRSPDESALRGQFLSFFANAQWVGDGSELAIILNGTRYVSNLELLVDPASGAFVGANIRPTENEEAVIKAFDDAKKSSGTTPIALLLDNKPSNHTQKVQDAVEPTTLMAATPFRAQNKAHVEGAFGLLKPALGEIDIAASSPEKLACLILALVVTVWGRTINQRPRRDRANRSRADLHQDNPTPEQIEAARKELDQIQQRLQRARKTRAARQDPLVRTFIAESLTRLNLDDPKGTFLTAIARYPLDAIVKAVAIFEGKKRALTLPEGVDVRYLLGIVSNVSQDREASAIAEALWEQRRRAGDLMQRWLEKRCSELAASHDHHENIIAALIDEAVASAWLPERFFFLKEAATTISEQPSALRKELYTQATRRIQATYTLSNRERQTAICFLAEKLLPLR